MSLTATMACCADGAQKAKHNTQLLVHQDGLLIKMRSGLLGERYAQFQWIVDWKLLETVGPTAVLREIEKGDKEIDRLLERKRK